MQVYTTHTRASAFQRHFISTDDAVFTATFRSHIKQTLRDTTGNADETAKDPPPGFNIVIPDML